MCCACSSSWSAFSSCLLVFVLFWRTRSSHLYLTRARRCSWPRTHTRSRTLSCVPLTSVHRYSSFSRPRTRSRARRALAYRIAPPHTLSQTHTCHARAPELYFLGRVPARVLSHAQLRGNFTFGAHSAVRSRARLHLRTRTYAHP